jgi:tRNA pseudouridine38-40 synthase
MTTWKLTIEYDGSRYRGWQAQKNARSIQETLRRAAEEVLGATAELQGAGRTDAGVHARAQVAHLKSRPSRRVLDEDLSRRLNERLPGDIVVIRAEKAPPRFHARHHARNRTYVYQISRRKQAFAKRYVWWVRDSLNLESMRRAAELVVGRHDFSRFRALDPRRPEESTIVVVESAEVVEEGDLILIRIRASHFLWKMVRRLVGALVKVGAGEIGLDEFAALVEGSGSPGLDVASWTAPAAGLFLESVRYAERSD